MMGSCLCCMRPIHVLQPPKCHEDLASSPALRVLTDMWAGGLNALPQGAVLHAARIGGRWTAVQGVLTISLHHLVGGP